MDFIYIININLMFLELFEMFESILVFLVYFVLQIDILDMIFRFCVFFCIYDVDNVVPHHVYHDVHQCGNRSLVPLGSPVLLRRRLAGAWPLYMAVVFAKVSGRVAKDLRNSLGARLRRPKEFLKYAFTLGRLFSNTFYPFLSNIFHTYIYIYIIYLFYETVR